MNKLYIALFIFCMAAIALAGFSSWAQEERRFGIEGTPVEYTGDTGAVILTASPDVVDSVCRGGAPVPEGMVALACTNPTNRTILLPNPCPYQEVDPYARLLCHELGHINGWKHDE